MNIIYIANIRIPTEKAHGYAIAKMCEEFARAGAQVTLVVPKRANPIEQDVFSYYGIARNFSVTYVPCVDLFQNGLRGRFAFWLQAFDFLRQLRAVDIPRDAIVVTRNPEVAWLCGKMKRAVFYDAHNFPLSGKMMFRFFLRGIRGVLANSFGTKKVFDEAGFKNVLALHNAVDLPLFESAQAASRRESGVPRGRIAMYVGHLYEWKGVDVVLRAARESQEKDLIFVFVGGTEEDLVRYRAKADGVANVVFLGHRSRKEVPSLIKLANVLLLPNVPSTKESLAYTSPIKMFEYMASGVPIVASDLPSIREVLSEKNAIMVKPGDSAALLLGIEDALSPRGQECAKNAREEVKKYTWETRAKDAIAFIQRTCAGS